jgi:Tol biopolymer transport system component
MVYYSAFEWENEPEPVRHLRWIVLSIADGKRLFAFDRPPDWTPGLLPAWAPDESGLDYVVTRKGVSNIWRLPFSGGPPLQVTHFSAGEIFAFSWSPDGKWLSLASGMSRSDVVVLTQRAR